MTSGGSGPRALHVVAWGGLAAGLLDIINATTFWFLYSGAPPIRILQAIAAGLLGKEAFAGGAATAALGLFLHFFIACGMATACWLACRQWPVLLQRPVAAGTAFGIGAYLTMTHVVVPLSRAAPPPFILPWFIDSVLAHVVLVGLPFAFIARWSATRR